MVSPFDPRSGGAAGEPLEVAGTPGWEVGGGGMVVADDVLWVVGSGTGGHAWLTRIDVRRGAVVGKYDLGGSGGDGVAVGTDGNVWVLMRDEKPAHVTVKRFDPVTEQIVATVPFESQWARRILAIGGGIVVQDDGANHQCLFARIDPSTNQVVAERPLHGCWTLASDGGELWGAYTDEVRQIDPTTGQAIGTPIEIRLWESGPLTIDGDRLWVPGASGRLQVLDSTSGNILASANGPKGSGIALAVDEERAWAIHYRQGMTIYKLAA